MPEYYKCSVCGQTAGIYVLEGPDGIYLKCFRCGSTDIMRVDEEEADCQIVEYEESACFSCKHDMWVQDWEGDWDRYCARAIAVDFVKTCPWWEPRRDHNGVHNPQRVR